MWTLFPIQSKVQKLITQKGKTVIVEQDKILNDLEIYNILIFEL